MLLMIIETFRDTKLVGERFERCGRLLPEGVVYHASWVDPVANRCFQVMEAPDQEALNRWISLWDDLIDFEIIPVMASIEFWART
ncbi:MAG: DUF3303 family protein [Pseudolabrys sp.]